MKVLFVSFANGKRPGAREIQVSRVIQALENSGVEIVPVLIKNELVKSNKTHFLNVKNRLNRIDIVLRSVLPYSLYNRGILNKLEDIIIKESPSIILTSSNPLESHIAGVFAKKKYGLKWIATFSDPRPLSKLPKPYGEKREYLRTIYEIRFLKRVLSQADSIIMPSLLGIELTQRIVKMNISNKSYVIPHIGFSKVCGEPSKSYLIHSGKLVAKRSSENVLLALKEYFKSRKGKISKLVCLGFVSNEFKELIVKYDMLDYVEFPGILSLQESRKWLSESKAILVIEADMQYSPFLPSKFCEAASCNKPILAISPKESSISYYLDRHISGISVRNSSDDILRGLNLLNSIDVVRNPRLFSAQSVAKKYKEIMSRLI